MSTAARQGRGSGQAGAADGPKVLEKALRVLDLFTRRQPEWNVTEIARELELPFATAHRIVRTLEAHSLLTRTAGRRYRLGEGAIALGRRAIASFDIIAALQPVMEWLWARTDETTTISVVHRRPLGALCVQRIEGNYPLRLSPDVGAVNPLHAGASAKALLAQCGEETLDRLAAEGPEGTADRPALARLATGTITDLDLLRGDLAEVRRRGWAFDREELFDGAWGMAISIRDPDEGTIASIGFAAPMVRLTPRIQSLGEEFMAEAAERAREALARRFTP